MACSTSWTTVTRPRINPVLPDKKVKSQFYINHAVSVCVCVTFGLLLNLLFSMSPLDFIFYFYICLCVFVALFEIQRLDLFNLQ